MSERFPSLPELRKAHRELLRAQRSTAAPDPEQLLAFLERACATGAILVGDAEREDAQTIVDYWEATLLRTGAHTSVATLADLDTELLPVIPDDRCPYVGLDAFQESDSDRFFGREELVLRLLAHLRESPLLVVSGSSGSGKSSVVFAGLLPQLRRGALPGSEALRYCEPMCPGADPVESLALALKPPELDAAVWLGGHRATLQTRPEHIVEMVAEAGASKVVLVVDQLEELFTLCDDEGLRACFARCLGALLSAEGRAGKMIVTLRSDFLDRAARLPEIGERMTLARDVLVAPPLGARDLRRAIEEPAARVGLKFEDGLVEQLGLDVLGEPAALPLLQFTLRELWERRSRNRVTWEAYRRMGGPTGALARVADALYAKLIPEDQTTAHRILLLLVKPVEGREFTRRRVRRESLYGRDDRARSSRVLEKLVAARLIRVTKGGALDDDRIEVAHEALIRNWPLLVSWLQQDGQRLRRRARLTLAAEQWVALKRDHGALLRGSLLDEALTYDDLNEAERVFVEASKNARADELERAQSTARRAIILAAASCVLAVTTVYVAWRSWTETQRAEAETQRALDAELKASDREIKALIALNDLKNAQKSTENATEALRKVEAARSAETRAFDDQGQYDADKLNLRGKHPSQRPGSSVGTLGGQFLGSICCFVQDSSGSKYLLSAKAALDGAPGDSVLQPAPADGGGPNDAIARLTDKSSSDAVLAKMDPGRGFMNWIPYVTSIKGVSATAEIGSGVRLVGRSSGVRVGKILRIDDKRIVTTRMSSPGDAGAPVVNAKDELVGILIGRNQDGESEIAPIRPIFDELGVELVPAPPVHLP